MKRYFLTYDIISSGMKTSVFSSDGQLLQWAYRPLVQHLSGCCAEQPVSAWLTAMRETTQEALQGLDATKIAAISFSAMSQVCLCIDRQGRPLHDAFTWSDSRADQLEDPIACRYTQQEVYQMTGLRNTACSSIRKFHWIRENWPEIYDKTWKMLQCKDYLAYILTGAAFTDYTDASSTGALDIRTMDWCVEILDCVHIDREKLPEIAYSNQVIGHVTEQAAVEYGLAAGIPVSIGAGDILCSAIGAGCIADGDVYMSLGSSSWVASCMDQPKLDPLMRTAINPHAIPGKFLGFVNYQTAGVVFKWLKNEVFQYENGRQPIQPYKNIYPYQGMEEMVSAAPAGAHGLLFLPHLLEGDPAHPESYARGAFIGLNWQHTREDMMRAALEGVCFELRRFVEAFCGDRKPNCITVTGIASHETGWLQMLADVVGVPVQNTNLHDTPDSIGAAIVAGQSVGVYEDFGQANFYRNYENVFIPDRQMTQKYDIIYNIYMDCFSAMDQVLQRLELVQ